MGNPSCSQAGRGVTCFAYTELSIHPAWEIPESLSGGGWADTIYAALIQLIPLNVTNAACVCPDAEAAVPPLPAGLRLKVATVKEPVIFKSLSFRASLEPMHRCFETFLFSVSLGIGNGSGSCSLGNPPPPLDF